VMSGMFDAHFEVCGVYLQGTATELITNVFARHVMSCLLCWT
jgi:hypothetical protein